MRANNGVGSKVTHDVKREIPGYSGKASDRGNVLNGGNINHGKAGTMADMASHHGPKGSSGKERDMGGVGDNRGTGRDMEEGFGTR